jgi:hypothetical protein
MLQIRIMEKQSCFLRSGAALVLVLWLWVFQAESSASPVISISPDDYNTGDISRITKPFTKVFIVTNQGNTLLSIAKIKYT